MNRMLWLLGFCLSCGPLAAYGVAAAGETALETESGPITLYPIHHASFVLRWNGRTLYVDPTGRADAYAGIGAADLVLITHAHPDHLEPDTLAALDTSGAVTIMPASVADRLDRQYGASRVVLANGDDTQQAGVSIKAVPMYNLPARDDAYHPKGWGNGYVLTLGGKRIYISGDTEGIPAMRSLADIDLAFVCMNLPYTMGVTQAADAVADFAPAVVYPYHYRGQDTTRFKDLMGDRDVRTEVRLRDWYPGDS